MGPEKTDAPGNHSGGAEDACTDLQEFSTPNLDAALGYAARGWPVVPIFEVLTDGSCACGKATCDPRGKHPRTLHGLKDATTDTDRVRAWYSDAPNANVAIATGRGLLVIDVDQKPDKDGVASLRALEAQHGELPLTRTIQTGSGGYHLYFGYPPELALGSASGKLGIGIDHRADDGYVIAPPSNHACGGTYDVLAEDPIAPAPAWLIELLQAKRPRKSSAPVAPKAPEQATERERIKARAMHSRELDRLRSLPDDGSRSHVRIVYTIGGLWPIPIEERFAECMRAVEHWNWDDAERQIRGQLEAGAEEPIDLRDFALTETGNAERLVSRHIERIRYVTTWRKWIAWDGQRWTIDGADAIVARCAKETVHSLDEEVLSAPSDDYRAALRKWATKSQTRQAREAMVSLARHEEPLGVGHRDLDRDPWLFNVANGTVDLRTGQLRPHDPADLITKLAPVAFDPAATCPLWDKFLGEVFDGNLDLISYVQRAVGYSLTAQVREHCMFFLVGKSRAGKGVLIRTIQRVSGDYAAPGAPDILLAKHNESHPTEQADLCGLRMVTLSEIDENRSWAQSTVKRLTGGDEIKARKCGEDFWWFQPTHKFWISANDKPRVSETGDAFWSRLRTIPFEVSFLGREDRTLEDRLATELPGILRWAIDGCLAWQHNGLREPVLVTQSTETYRQEQDLIGQFVTERCVLGPEARVTRVVLRSAYERFCAENGDKPKVPKAFAEYLRSRHGVTSGNIRDDDKTRDGWKGIALKSAELIHLDAAKLPPPSAA